MAKKRKKSNPKANCCPRVAVVCKKTAGVNIVEPYVMVNETFTKPLHRKATAHVPGVVKCAIVLGKRAITPFRTKPAWQKLSMSKALDRAHNELKRRGCEHVSANMDRANVSQGGTSRSYPTDTPSVVKDRLQKRIEKLTSR